MIIIGIVDIMIIIAWSAYGLHELLKPLVPVFRKLHQPIERFEKFTYSLPYLQLVTQEVETYFLPLIFMQESASSHRVEQTLDQIGLPRVT